MIREVQPTLLLVGVSRRPHWSATTSFYTAAAMREAIATIRLVDFDLLVVGLENNDLDIWDFLHRVLGAWPQQRWILASEQVTTEDEVLARSLGALMVLNLLPDDQWLTDFATALRRRDLPRTSPTSVSFKSRFVLPEHRLVPAKAS